MSNYDIRAYAGGALGGISGVVTAGSYIPDGYSLGEERWEGGVKYRLFYNGGGASITAGYSFKHSVTVGASPYSVTVSVVTETITQAMGCVAHKTVPTAAYFWGAVYGGPVKLMVSNVSIATQALVMIAADGNHTLTATSTAAVARNLGTGTSCTTDARGGQFFLMYEKNAPLV
jgi:hypothetical protein